MATATEETAILATGVEFNMVLTKTGEVTVPGSPWRVIPGAEAPESLRLAAEAVVTAEHDVDAAEAALAQVEVDGMNRAVGVHRKHLRSEAWERHFMSQQAFEAAVCRRYRWSVVVVHDHAVWLTEPGRGRPEVVVEPLGGKHTCPMCRGLARERAPYGHLTAPMGTVVPCRLCEGSGVRGHKIPTWIVEGLARHAAVAKAKAIETAEF